MLGEKVNEISKWDLDIRTNLVEKWTAGIKIEIGYMVKELLYKYTKQLTNHL